ncbi:uncharacterized protein [Coffea arabica]|uniref:Uncharacterized protein n=1 Tax=Coffea arabica TaxID=13443 RepID=A0ABM4UTX3_COFAR
MERQVLGELAPLMGSNLAQLRISQGPKWPLDTEGSDRKTIPECIVHPNILGRSLPSAAKLLFDILVGGVFHICKLLMERETHRNRNLACCSVFLLLELCLHLGCSKICQVVRTGGFRSSS